ncbi:MAG: DUF4097 family beta strand repeat-containing protein [Ruminococcus sp.]
MKRAKKIWIIAAVIAIVAGLIISFCVFFMWNFDFSRMSTIQLETNTYFVDEAFRSIRIEGAECDVRLVPSDQAYCEVVCTEKEHVSNTIKVSDDTLIITRKDNRKWYESIGIDWNTCDMELTLYLPESDYETLYVKSLSGDTEIPASFTFSETELYSSSGDIVYKAATEQNLTAETSSGDVAIRDLTAESIHMESSSGSVKISSVTVKNKLTIQTVSGDITLSDVHAKELSAECSSGDMAFSHVIALNNIRLESVSGDIHLNKSDAEALWLKTSSGDVSGSLLSDKIFLTQTSSGDVDVPACVSGTPCEITTSSGDIKIAIQPEP